MNLLEHYIIEVLKITDLDIFSSLIEVNAICDCWGDKRIYTHITTRDKWEQELKQGYFLA